MKNSNEQIESQIKEYMEQIEIPDTLDECVKKSIEIGKLKNKRVINMTRWMRNMTTSVAVLGLAFVGTANISPTFAKSMSEIPVLSGLVKVVTFGQYDYADENYEANIKAPLIDGMKNEALQAQLNQKYLQENKKLYEAFKTEIAGMKELGKEGHLGTEAGFEIKTDNGEVLSIARYVENTAAYASTQVYYDTIDKKNEVLITLPSLFKDGQYVEVISEYIKNEMKKEMKEDENKVYWVEDSEEGVEGFKQIGNEQSFYINENGKLVIAFEEYEVAPGYMGNVEFEIPTEVIQESLVSNAYIK